MPCSILRIPSSLIKLRWTILICPVSFTLDLCSFKRGISWNKSVDCCSWDEVTCDNVTGNVIGLYLAYHPIHGTLYSNNSLHLPKLQVLDMSRCNLTKLPYFLSSLESLTNLSLSYNKISGEIPRWFWGISQHTLKHLDLSNNFLEGGIHQLHWKRLLYINLQENSLQGPLPIPSPSTRYFYAMSNGFTGEIPSSICQLSSLLELDLFNNSLSGTVPPCFDNITNLDFLDLSSNKLQGPLLIPSPSTRYFYATSNGFTGEIPSSICQLSSLLILYLSNNNLSGTVPACFGNITNLHFLSLGSNKLQGPLPIPSPSTRYFYVDSNGFTGEIPSSICHLSSLLDLDVSNNNLLGTVPPCFGNITNINFLDLGSNKLQGPLPILSPSIGKFTATSNGFTSEIPSSICQLSSLWVLDLSNNSFLGNIPPCFGNITNLEDLDLSSNKLQGSLPRFLVKWASISTLSLGHNEFNDIFPHWLKAPQLRYLDLQSNKFHGRINLIAFELSFPALGCLFISNNNFIGWWPTKDFSNTSLQVIDLSNNKFGGPIPLPSPVTMYYSIANNVITGRIPSLICNATNLEMIDLSNNSLIGNLPWCLTNFSTVLSVLNLGMNHFEGTIPQTIALIHRLTTLDLSRNRFEGTLPRSLVNCTNLEILDLSVNKMEDTFPTWLGKLPQLKVLILSSNNLKGPLNIPKGDLIFTELRILDLSNNNFCGPLLANLIMNLEGMKHTEDGRYGPSYMIQHSRSFWTSYENTVTVMIKGKERKLVKILTIFTTINLSHNLFQGEIPEVFGHLRYLIGLNLSHNHLTSSIPLTLGNLTNLEWLDLSSNMLSGRIPRALGDLTYLGYLNLSKNQLTGQISQDKQLSTFLNDSFSGNPGLCGTPLSKGCLGDAQPPPPSSSSTLDREGHEIWFKHKVVWMGYASGIVIGISIAYIAIQTGWPKWLARGVRMLERSAVQWMEKPKRRAIKFHGR
ncbi:hypothetical protein ACJRO7_022794 [Eucalyptus globulus]|uniref:Leucine-rich repeat-containing N-terminal plant-type domain-containing protein n=1 Tax=Eucalyptus globulus TaxID=34317 RepID=A0ABD3JZL5_EUCGL